MGKNPMAKSGLSHEELVKAQNALMEQVRQQNLSVDFASHLSSRNGKAASRRASFAFSLFFGHKILVAPCKWIKHQK